MSNGLNAAATRITIRTICILAASWSAISTARVAHVIQEANSIQRTSRCLVAGLAQRTLHCVRNTGSGFGANFTVVAVSGINTWAGWASRAVARNTCVVLTNVPKLTITNVTTALFTKTAGWVAVFVKVAVYG